MAGNNTEEYVDEILEALRANIEYLKTAGDSKIVVRDGELIAAPGDLFLYEFVINATQALDVDAEIEVRIHSRSTQGKVTAVNDQKLQIQVEDNLGTSIPEATLILSSYFLLEKLVDFIENTRQKSNNLEQKIFGGEISEIGLDNTYTIPPSKAALNNYQEEALRFVLGSEVSYLWGPPGTGKTQTIASIIEALLSRDLSVLLISHTNAATDQALLKLVDKLKDTSDYHEGRFLRVGRETPELSKYNVVAEKILETKAKPIKLEIEEAQSRIDLANQRIKAHKGASFMLFGKSELVNEKNNLEEFIEHEKTRYSETEVEISKLNQAISQIDKEMEEHQSKGVFGKLFSGTSVDLLTQKKTNSINEMSTLKNTLLEINSKIMEAKLSLKVTLEKVTKFEKENTSKDILSDDELKNYQNEIINTEKQMLSLRKQLDSISEELINDAKVIATTLTMSYSSKKILSREYDCIILDEASMAPMPAIYAAATLAKKKMILVGDFYQLPPIAKHEVLSKGKSEEEQEKESKLVATWLKQDIFEFVGITDSVTHGNEDKRLKQLKIQYRMNPVISGLVNHLVYSKGDGKYSLENGPSTDEIGVLRLKAEPLSGDHLGIYDTSELGSMPVKTESGSYYNLSHALLILELVRQAIHSGFDSIGVISSYRAQVNLIQKIFTDSLSKADLKKVLVDTVHKFQGGEKQLILFDVTTPKSPSMYDDYKEGGDDMKLMNVAISRAQEKCVVIVDVAKVNKQHSESSLVKSTISYAQDNKKPMINSLELLETLVPDDRTESWLEKINDPKELNKITRESGLFSEVDFYPIFIKDLLNAKVEIIIHSPFITTFRTEQFKPIFKQLLHKGVRIFLFTRPPDEHKDNLRDMSKVALKELEEMGVVVLPLTGFMHQKIAIIDRRVLFEGSLNIMSQRDSKEFMRRFEGENVANQMVSFLRIDKNIGSLGQNNLKHCEVCTEPGAWYWTLKTRRWNTLWTFCLAGHHSPGKPPKTKAERVQKKKESYKIREKVEFNSDGIPICPMHHVKTVLKRGPFSEFYGCPEYKECNFAISKQKADKLYDMSSK